MIKSIDRSLANGKKILEIKLDISYLKELNKNFDRNSGHYMNTMEDLFSVWAHEIHAHGINKLSGTNSNEMSEHAKYNHNGKRSLNSPTYRSTPADGLSPASRDKINIKDTLMPLRSIMKNRK